LNNNDNKEESTQGLEFFKNLLKTKKYKKMQTKAPKKNLFGFNRREKKKLKRIKDKEKRDKYRAKIYNKKINKLQELGVKEIQIHVPEPRPKNDKELIEFFKKNIEEQTRLIKKLDELKDGLK